MINIKKMMQQAQEMQQRLAEMQEKFKDIDVSGEAGGGKVKATMNCAGDILGISIDPSVIVPDDKETLEDLIVAALNNAIKAKNERIEQETQGMVQELGLPSDTQLPF
jgi:DNA-binding YbaB/EbfC family protein